MIWTRSEKESSSNGERRVAPSLLLDVFQAGVGTERPLSPDLVLLSTLADVWRMKRRGESGARGGKEGRKIRGRRVCALFFRCFTTDIRVKFRNTR